MVSVGKAVFAVWEIEFCQTYFSIYGEISLGMDLNRWHKEKLKWRRRNADLHWITETEPEVEEDLMPRKIFFLRCR
jgi:hypothetical protein